MKSSLYPYKSPFNSFFMKVGDRHELYIEEYGVKGKVPLFVLHGGPGSGSSSYMSQMVDLDKCHLIIFDQRGAGKSRPRGCIEENTTQDLIEDIEKIRVKLKLGRIHLVGGSWGSTLTLAYAQSYPLNIESLLLRGVFLGRKKDINWLYQSGVEKIFPDLWDKYISGIPKDKQSNILGFYYKSIHESLDQEVSRKWSIRFGQWEAYFLGMNVLENQQLEFMEAEKAEVIGRIESHYFFNECFLTGAHELLRNCHKIKKIPTTIIHGRYDMICPVDQAYELKAQLPLAKLIIVERSGHSGLEKNILEAVKKQLRENIF